MSLPEPIIALSADGPDLDPVVHGAKAVGLQRLMRFGLPVPPAVVVPVSSARAIAADQSTGRDELRAAMGALVRPGDRLAVRSGAAVSLPGAFETLLDVAPADVEAERDRLREEIASIEDTARAVAEGEAERDALRAEVAELEGMLEEALDGKVPVAAAETGDDEAVATLTRERDEARGVSKDLTDKIRHMMLEQSQLQSRAEQAERGRDEMQRRVDVARREKAAAMDRIKEVMGRLAEADRRVVGLQTRLRNDTRRLVGYIQQLRAASGMEVQEVELSSEDIARLQAAGVEVIELDG